MQIERKTVLCSEAFEEYSKGNIARHNEILVEAIDRLSEEVAILADDLHAGNTGGQETLRIMKEYIQRIYSEMSRLDNKDDNQEDGV